MTTAQPNRTDVSSALGTITDLLAEILCVDRDSLDTNAEFTTLGLDSVLSVEYAARLRQVLDVAIRAGDLYEYATPQRLAERLAG